MKTITEDSNLGGAFNKYPTSIKISFGILQCRKTFRQTCRHHTETDSDVDADHKRFFRHTQRAEFYRNATMSLTSNLPVDTRIDIVFSSFEIQVKYLKSSISWTLVKVKL